MRLWERDSLPGVEVKGANGSTSSCALAFSGDTESGSLLLTSCFAFAFVRLRVRELVARPVAAHLLLRVWGLREIDARPGALNFFSVL